MDIFNILGYVNKMSLLAFVVTLGVLLYQVYLLKKDAKHTDETPVIPDFNENIAAPSVNYTKLAPPPVTEEPKKPTNLIVLIVITFVVIAFLSFAILAKNTSQNKIIQSEPLIKLVASKGIKIYDDKWIELDSDKIATLSGGSPIIVGLDKTEDVNIDGARIRINKSNWSKDDENVKYDEQRKVFYRDFVMATESGYLKAEAQLHSSVDGWLGE